MSNMFTKDLEATHYNIYYVNSKKKRLEASLTNLIAHTLHIHIESYKENKGRHRSIRCIVQESK